MDNMNKSTIEYLVAKFNRKIRLSLNRELLKYGLNEANFYYLFVVINNPGINQVQMIKLLDREQSIVTKQISNLVKNGWLEKRKSTTDHRQTELYPTSKILDNIDEITEITEKVSAEVTSNHSEKESATYKNYCKKFYKLVLEKYPV